MHRVVFATFLLAACGGPTGDGHDAGDASVDAHSSDVPGTPRDVADVVDVADVPTSLDANDDAMSDGSDIADVIDVVDVVDGSSNDAADVTTSDAGRIACGSGFATEVFRDDFDGTAIDTTRWDVVQQRPGGGVFTQITAMLRANVTVTGGMLHVASKRHCADPYPAGSPEHPSPCTGSAFYSGGWIRSARSYAAGHGLAIFVAQVPTAVRGSFPGLWMRNTDGTSLYGELDLIEQWWDNAMPGRASTDIYSATTWIAGSSGLAHTGGNTVGPFAGLNAGFHVWEVEWDASVPSVTYFYREQPGATRQRVRVVDASSSGLAGNVTPAQLASVLALGWRPYVDFAVQPQTAYHSSPDAPPPAVDPYDPGDLVVDSVVVCAP